jgi:hypothetical protein
MLKLPQGVNLRGDLSKLSDSDLADRLARLHDEFDRLESPLRKIERFFDISNGWRGPVRARPMYSIWLFLSRGMSTSSGRQTLVLYEIQDIQDEMQRRLAGRERRVPIG